MAHDARRSPADLLALVRSTAPGDRKQLETLPLDDLARSVATLAPCDRADFLERSPRGPEVVPLLPETAFTSAVLATGIEHAGWLLEHATADQRVAALDLDCWQNHRPDPERFDEWIDALIDAGPETLARAFDELDFELWIVLLQRMADFRFLARGEWADVPTLDGLVGIEARSSEAEERVRQILGTAVAESPEHYWQFVLGAMNESALACQEAATAKQRGRLVELGFPERGQAMGVYRPLALDAIQLAVGHGPTESTSQGALAAPLQGTLLGSALAGLPQDRAAEVFADVLGVANALAVADELPLAEPESVTRSLEKAIAGIEHALVALTEARARSTTDVLAHVAPAHLFRAGATLDPALRTTKTRGELDREADTDPWAVPTETVAESDQTLVDDGAEIEHGPTPLRSGDLR